MIRFITFEGGDGSGKTTQVQTLERYFSQRGQSCQSTREPGGTSIGELLRRVLLETGNRRITSETELFLYLADRAQHIHEIIVPALQQGKIVLCDRYTDSTLAYQGYGRGIDLQLLRRLNELVSQGIKPDLTLLLDCPVEIGLFRTAQRRSQIGVESSEDRFEREKLEFHERVRKGFLELARAEPDRFRIINAAGSSEAVAEAIKNTIDELVK